MKTLDAAIPLGRMAEPGGDRQRRRLPGRRRCELHDRDDRLRRRRHHAQQSGPVAWRTRCSAHPSVLVVGGGFAGTSCARAPRQARRARDARRPPQLQPVPAAALPDRDGAGRRDAVARPLRASSRKAQASREDGDIADVDPATKTATSADGITFSATTSCWRWGRGELLQHARCGTACVPPVRAPRRRASPVAPARGARGRGPQPEAHRSGRAELVVIGAGATGVETAGALADLINDVIPERFHDCAVEAAQIYLVDPASGRARAVLRRGARVRRKVLGRRACSSSSE